jgi:hypothetical protein
MKSITRETLDEIEALGGLIDRVEQRRHVRLYWRSGDSPDRFDDPERHGQLARLEEHTRADSTGNSPLIGVPATVRAATPAITPMEMRDGDHRRRAGARHWH